ncbi:MAG: hypothetical protein UDK36_01810 [Bacteroidaceae bacterium]|nr:hypothetical protein [Bacteroidaceae bacterium]
MKKTFLTCLLALLMAGSAHAQFGRRVDNGPASLKEAYKDYFTFGVAVNGGNACFS